MKKNKMIKIITSFVVLLCIIGCSSDNPEATHRKEKGVMVDIDIQWGGFYASKEKGEELYSVFRLLDFNQYSYHIAIFKEKFQEVPSLDDVLKLSSYIGHAPIDSKVLLRGQEIHLIGGPILSNEDLRGYRYYLEEHEMEENDINEMFQDIIGFGKEPPMKLTLSLKYGELDIKER